MKIDRKKFVEALTEVQPALASKEIIEQSHSFVFKDKKIFTYNDQIAISHPIDLDVEGAVKGEELYKLLNKTKAKELEIETTSDEFLITTKRSRAGICLESEINLPLDEIGKAGKWIKLPKTFCQAIRFCLFSVSQDMTKRTLTCLHIKGRYVQSCDNFRATQYDMGGGSKKSFERSMLLPGSAAEQLVKYDPTQYAISKNAGWIHFKSESGTIFCCRTYKDKYPNIKKLLDVEGKKITMPKKMKSMLERAGIFTKTDVKLDEQVEITISKNKLSVYGKGTSGWFKESAKVKYDGKKVKFIVHPEFLRNTLDLLNVLVIGDNRLKLESDQFIHVVLLQVV